MSINVVVQSCSCQDVEAIKQDVNSLNANMNTLQSNFNRLAHELNVSQTSLTAKEAELLSQLGRNANQSAEMAFTELLHNQSRV